MIIHWMFEKRIHIGLCLTIFFIQLFAGSLIIQENQYPDLQTISINPLRGDGNIINNGYRINALSSPFAGQSPFKAPNVQSGSQNPSGIHRSLAEEPAPVIEDYVDQKGIVDSSYDRGTHDLFSDLQANDSSYNNMTEADIANITLINAESFEGSWLPTGWTEVPGNSRWAQESYYSYDGSFSAQIVVGDGTQSGTLESPTMDTLSANAIYIEFWWRDGGFEDSEFFFEVFDGTDWNIFQDMNVPLQTEGVWRFYSVKITDVAYFKLNFKIRWRASDFLGDAAYVDYVNVYREDDSQFNLDLEVQFTDVIDFLGFEEIAIRTGSFGGSEDINVTFWNVTTSSWQFIDNLTASSWNNYSVSLTSSTFTIKFGGWNTITDSIQDWWEIDAVLLRVNDTGAVFGNEYGFVWLDSPDEVPLGSTYRSWVLNQDLSAYSVPSNATGVILAWISTGGVRNAVARGSEDKKQDYMNGGLVLNEIESETWRMQIVKLGAHKYIDTWRESSGERLYVMGYTVGTDPRFRSVPTDLGSLTADGSWNNLTVSGVDENTTGLILFAQVLSGGDTSVLVRAINSTDNMIFREWEQYNNGFLAVKIDENDKFQYFITNGRQVKFYLIAEVGDSIDWLDTNRTDISVTGSTNTWTTRVLDDYVTVPNNATGVLLQFESEHNSADGVNIARKYGKTLPFARYDVGGDQWLIGGTGIDQEHRIDIIAETLDQNVYIHALTLYYDITPPEVINFGIDDPGTENNTFWAIVTDNVIGVENVTVKINNTGHGMSYNGTYWVNDSVPIEFGKYYTYQIVNASDMIGNNVTDPTVKSYTFLNDVTTPKILNAEFDTIITFNTNVSDLWGEIDSVIVNVTMFDKVQRSGYTAIMRNTAAGYINDTLIIDNGLIHFNITVNDTVGNAITKDFVSYRGFNSPPSAENITLSPNPVHSNESLTLNYDFKDLQGDSEGGTEIRWYKNLNLQPIYNDTKIIPASVLIKTDQWSVTIRPKDGQLFGTLETSSIMTVRNTAPQVTSYSINTGNPAVPGVIVEDEDIVVTYTFFDSDNDINSTIVQWYIDGKYDTQLDGMMVIPANKTRHSETWRVEIRPHDGSDYGSVVTSSVFVESRPVLNNAQFIAENDTEGHYRFEFNITDSRNDIKQVEVIIYIKSTEERYVITSGNGSSWELDYQLSNLMYLNSVTAVSVTVITEAGSGIIFEIEQNYSFNFTIKDEAAPRVIRAWFDSGETRNPSNITFFAEIDERGTGISGVVVFYAFESAENGGGGASLFQQVTSIRMKYQGKSGEYYLYSTTVEIGSYNTNLDIIYWIYTRDTAGNIDDQAFNNSGSAEQRIPFNPPGLPDWVLLVAALVVFLIFVGSIVYVKFIREPELVGLDKERVMIGTSHITEAEISNSLDAHTIGVVVSFFDQAHGPIPIIVIPEILKDNFSKLVELSDRSFSVTGFADTFDVEIHSSFDFILHHGIRISTLSFGYFLSRPEARGGQENITLNILIQQEVFPLLNHFKEEIQDKVHEIHLLMNEKEQDKNLIRKQIFGLRKLITVISLSYQGIYGTIELLEEDGV